MNAAILTPKSTGNFRSRILGFRLFRVYSKKILLVLGLFLFVHSVGYTASGADTNADKQKKEVDSLKTQLSKSNQSVEALTKQIKSKDKLKAEPYPDIFQYGTWAIFIIGIGLCIFLIGISVAEPKQKLYPLGLPEGSVRAIIAILALVFYILISITFALLPFESTIASDVTKTLGTLVVAISAFYFGSKAADQANKSTTAALTNLISNNAGQSGTTAGAVPVAVIQDAITAKKDNWMTLYGSTNVVLGKKQLTETKQYVDCIVFIIAKKSDDPTAAPAPVQPVPSSIPYSSQGIDYNIPTDVQTSP